MGPLSGIRVVELPNIGPMQFAGMALSDLGAEVLRLDRAADVVRGEGTMPASSFSSLDRGRRSAGIDLKNPRGAEVVLKLCEQADVLLEGFRPGVAERLGIGPDACRGRNPRLVYGRMTGWGQTGPLAADPGHDINYIALAGVLHHIGAAGGPPVPPINLIGDFGGGGLLLAFGILAALLERDRSGEGQVVDAAMVDGAAMLMSIFVPLNASGFWSDERGTNLLDGGAHFYGVYEASDGTWLSIASYEPKFYANLLALLRPLGFEDLDGTEQMDQARWPELKERFAALFRTRTRAEWEAFFAGHEVCFAPVLTMGEAREHPHNVARGTFTEVDGAPQPAPAPRFGRTPAGIAGPPVAPGADTDAALLDWGFSAGEIEDLRSSSAIA
jgi:alpha-methylacyl-CoA racemase